jgi:hypothetical protein
LSPVQKLDKAMQSLGTDVAHGPLLLAWSVARCLYLGADEDITSTRQFGNMALQLNAFDFLSEMLDTEPFCGKSVRFLLHYLTQIGM